MRKKIHFFKEKLEVLTFGGFIRCYSTGIDHFTTILFV